MASQEIWVPVTIHLPLGTAKRWGEATLEIAQELRDALDEYRQAARHKELAYLDPLTGLANRYAFEQAMSDRISHCRRSGERFVSFCASSSICEASSRVGAMTTARGLAEPSEPTVDAPEAAVLASAVQTGTRKAAVLPLPVCAQHIRSLPASASGTACFWIGVGVL